MLFQKSNDTSEVYIKCDVDEYTVQFPLCLIFLYYNFQHGVKYPRGHSRAQFYMRPTTVGIQPPHNNE